LASSINNGSSVSHHSASKIIIMVQTFVILSLTYWIVEDYLNNQYLRQYVSDSFQANGSLFGILALLLVIGPATGLFLKHRHGRGTVSLDIKTPIPTVSPTISVAKSQESKKPDTDFHPVVAALKAEMADRRLSFGSMAGSSIEQPSTSPVPTPEIRKTSVLDQLASNRQPPMTGPRPGQVGPALPQQPLRDFKPMPPTGPRVDQPAGLLVQRPLPVLPPQQPAGSSVLQSHPAPAAQIPTNVTTVITGILPVKKKDPGAAEEKPSSSQ
jgi:hypothetical protein